MNILLKDKKNKYHAALHKVCQKVDQD